MTWTYDFNLVAIDCEEREEQELRDTIVYIALTFEPNRAGVDRVFFLQSIEELIINRFDNYDRWGELVFSASNILSNKPELRWDGTMNGTSFAQGVYVYFIKVELGTQGAEEFVDDVTLFR